MLITAATMSGATTKKKHRLYLRVENRVKPNAINTIARVCVFDITAEKGRLSTYSEKNKEKYFPGNKNL